jgi:hypothetical protein
MENNKDLKNHPYNYVCINIVKDYYMCISENKDKNKCDVIKSKLINFCVEFIDLKNNK